MVKIAYVDHSYHRTTRSTHFLREMLVRRGHEVCDFWDDAWQGGAPVDWTSVQGYDVVIMFQSYCNPGTAAFRQMHPNVIYIPMLDQFGIWQGPMFNQMNFWAPFQGSKVLNFSSALHCLTTGFGIASHYARYYQPARKASTSALTGLRGFFWLRREDQVNWALVRKLIEGSQFDGFHIHLAGDPGAPQPELPSDTDVATYNITTSTWFEDRDEVTALVNRANVYFAPRMEEGIGQSFLEAMARGKCVVAPNQGTMNEYILHGLNGLLYDYHAPCPLDFSKVEQLGASARESVAIGHMQWLASEEGIVRFILTPSEDIYVDKYQHVFPSLITDDCSVESNLSTAKNSRSLWHPLFEIGRRVRRFFDRF